MAKVPNGVETLPKISFAWVGCTNVADGQTTDRRSDDDICFCRYPSCGAKCVLISWTV